MNQTDNSDTWLSRLKNLPTDKNSLTPELTGLKARLLTESYKFVPQAQAIAKKMAATYQSKKSAYILKNSSIKNTGSIKLSRLANYRTSDEIFNKKEQLREGGNHALVIFLDNSASMVEKLPEVANQFLVFSLFAKYAGIKLSVTSFSGSNRENYSNYNLAKEVIDDTDSIADIIDVYYGIYYQYILMQNFRLHTTKSSSEFVLGKMGNTPLHEASILAYHKAMEYRLNGIENVSITFITDGDSTSTVSSKPVPLKDPYSNYTILVTTNTFIPEMNKMIRIQNIKTFNVYLAGRYDDFQSVLHNGIVSMGSSANIGKYATEEYYHQIKREKPETVIIDGFMNYNSVIFQFAYVTQFTAKKLKKDPLLGTNSISTMKKYSTIGNHFLQTVLQDFAL